jgi:hypothetical protein
MAADTTFLKNTNADINEQLMTAQQQLALAQALRGQSLQPIQAPPGQNGRISPLSVLAQALNGYTANGKMQGATHDLAGAQAAQAQNQWAMMAKMLNPDPDQPSPPPAPASTAPAAGATAPPQDAGPTLSSTPQASIPGVSAAPGGAAPFAAQDPRSDPRYRQMAMAEQLGVLPQGSAAAYAKAKYDYAAPTTEQKNANDPTIGSSVQSNLATQNMTDLQRLQRARALLPPGSAQVKEIDDQIAKLSYVAPKDVAPGVLTLDKYNKPLAYNPPAIRGAVPKFETRDGFTTAPSVTPQRGAAAVNANMEGAEQGAREANTIKTVTNPDGSSRTDYGARVAGTTGPSTTDATIQKTAADGIAQAPQIAQQSSQARAGLENALVYLDKVGQSGPGTKQKFNVLAMLNSAGIPIEKGDVNGYQSMQKYLANSLNTAAQGTGAGGSDARFDSFMHGQPNAETMSPDALRGAVKYVLSQHDAALARSQFLPAAYGTAKQKGDPNAAITAQQQWSQAYNPKVFEFNRMSPDERQQFKSSLTPEKQQVFGQQYNAAHQHGWVQ